MYLYMGDSIVALYILFVGCIWFLFGLWLGDKKIHLLTGMHIQ